jgi:UDP-2,4-diacetamido-2,4,6-trideoxy-beta-L-altropyranose hydrolase
MATTLLVRADASTRRGTGHIMRCLALAQRWRRTGPAVFAVAECPRALIERLHREGCEVRELPVVPGSIDDARAVVALAGQTDAAWIVVDGYHFDAPYQREVHTSGRQLLVLDDFGHAGEYSADFVLNQNLDADAALYCRRSPETRLLLGPRFALLRAEYASWRGHRREILSMGRKILVTLGGADADNVAGRVIDAIAQLEEIETTVVLGGSNPHRAAIEAAVRERAPAMRVVVDTQEMPQWMAWADVAVAAGGSTSWELAFMGLPSLVFVLADNQVPVAEALQRHGVSVSLGRATAPTSARVASALRDLLHDPAARARMSQAGRALVDGNGAARVVAHLKAADVDLRLAAADDCRTFFDWANDPAVRAASFAAEPIDWETHARWFTARLHDPQCRLYIARYNQSEIGPIRFEEIGNGTTISLSLAPSARGQDLAAALILRGVDQIFRDSSTPMIHAFIKPENGPSLRAFQIAGFSDDGNATVRGLPARRFVLHRGAP